MRTEEVTAHTRPPLVITPWAAHRHRGVRVRVITDVEQQRGQGSDAERIRQAGIALRYDLEDKYHMHHKVRSRRRRGIAMSRPCTRPPGGVGGGRGR